MQQAQTAVFGPEVVAPLADAMRLVNRKQAQLATRIQPAQQVLHARRVDAFWRSVQKRQLGVLQLLFNGAAFVEALG